MLGRCNRAQAKNRKSSERAETLTDFSRSCNNNDTFGLCGSFLFSWKSKGPAPGGCKLYSYWILSHNLFWQMRKRWTAIKNQRDIPMRWDKFILFSEVTFKLLVFFMSFLDSRIPSGDYSKFKFHRYGDSSTAPQAAEFQNTTLKNPK